MRSDRAQFLHCLGEHFATAERATAIDFSLFQSLCAAPPPAAPVQVENLPTLEALAQGFAALKPGKAPAISGLAAEIYRQDPARAAIAHYPILLKSLSNNHSPLLWRGGVATPIPKPGKNPGTVRGWRSVLLLEPSFKAVAAAVRPPLLDGLQQLTCPGLAGARKGQPLTLPALLVSLHISTLQKEGASGAVLFLDGESAFYNTARAFLHPQSEECCLAEWVHKLHSDGRITDALRDLLRQKDLLAAASVADEIRQLLRTGLNRTWYTVDPAHTQVYRTHFGTVPGAPLADLLFVMTYTVFIDSLMAALQQAGLRCGIAGPSHEHVLAPIPTWLDDSAILIRSSSASAVPGDVAEAARLAHLHLATIGVPLNLIKGKSEALLVLRGEGARITRHAVMIDHNCEITLDHARSLAVTDRYTHLGSVTDYRASPTEDIARRARLAESVFKPLRTRILRNPCLEPSEKKLLLEGMVLQKFLFGMERWSHTRRQEAEQYRTHYMGFVRRSLRPIFGCSSKLLTDEQVCTLAEMLSPVEARNIQLFRALSQAICSDIPYLHMSIQREGTWAGHAIVAANHIGAALGRAPIPPMPSEPQAFPAWVLHYRQLYPTTAQTCKHYRKACIAARAAAARDIRDICHYRQRLEDQGALIAHGPRQLDVITPQPIHACDVCMSGGLSQQGCQGSTCTESAPDQLRGNHPR